MTMYQDVIACFKEAFAKNQNGNQPVLNAKISDYNIPLQQLLLILGMTRDCLAKKGWEYTLPADVDLSETIQALIQSIFNATKRVPAPVGVAFRKPPTKKKVGKKIAKKKSAKKKSARKKLTKRRSK